MKQLTKQQAIKAFSSSLVVVYKNGDNYKLVSKHTKLSVANEFILVGG
jgi:hypothetical protein